MGGRLSADIPHTLIFGTLFAEPVCDYRFCDHRFEEVIDFVDVDTDNWLFLLHVLALDKISKTWKNPFFQGWLGSRDRQELGPGVGCIGANVLGTNSFFAVDFYVFQLLLALLEDIPELRLLVHSEGFLEVGQHIVNDGFSEFVFSDLLLFEHLVELVFHFVGDALFFYEFQVLFRTEGKVFLVEFDFRF